MNVGDVVKRGALRRAALRYAERGWPVVPGAMHTKDRYVCGPLCPTVACHPALDHWELGASSDPADIDCWWEVGPFSVLLATGHAFDVIEVPGQLGLAALRTRRTGPVAAAPGGRWLFLVGAGHGLRPELASRLDIVLHGRGSWMAAPPTRTATGRWRWQVRPTTTGWRVPDPYAVQQLLIEHLDAARPSTVAASTSGLRWAA